MKAQANGIRIQFDGNMKPEIVVSVTTREPLNNLQELTDALAKDKLLDVEIKVHRNRRSLNANAYLWVILGQIAEVQGTTKDEVYLLMLERYGQFTPVIVKPEAVERLKQEWRTVRGIVRGKIGKDEGVQLLCYYGSHTYDSREFSILLNGVIDEAKQIGIAVLSDSEKNLLIEEWGRTD